MTKESFNKAKERHPVQIGIGDRNEILYHGFKFVEEDGVYDVLEIDRGEYQTSIKKDLNKLALFRTLPFTYVCDLYYSHKQTKRLLKMELNALNGELSDNSKMDMIETKKRLRKSLGSFCV